MSDKVSAVVSIAPAAAPGRVGAFVQPGSGAANAQNPDQAQGVKNPSTSGAASTDLVTLQSLQAEHTLQTGPGKSPTQSVSQAQAQETLYAAEAAAQAQAKAQVQEQQQNQEHGVQQAASTLSNYFSGMHPDVSFRVEQQNGGMVVVMVNSLDGKVLQTISGDEAKQLATSLFGKSSVLPQTA